MRASRSKWLAIFAVVTLFLIVFVIAIVTFDRPRSAVARLAVAIFLRSKGFELAATDLELKKGLIELRDTDIEERGAGPFFRAPLVRIDYALAGLHLTQARIEIDKPVLVIRREKDGTFNLNKLMPTFAAQQGAPTPARPSTPLRAAISLRNATLAFINQFSPSRSGRQFAIEDLDVVANINQGAISSGHLSGVIVTTSARSSLSGSFIENDELGLGQAHASARHVHFGPILNYFVSSPAFIVNDGEADAAVYGYAVAGNAGSAPQWQLTATGTTSGMRLGLVPLIAQVRDVHGPFSFGDGILTLTQMKGTVAGLPLAAYGAIALIPSVALHIHVQSSGPLSKARNLLAALKRLPATGNIEAAVRVDGSPDNPRVAVAFAMPDGFTFANAPIGSASGTLVLNNGHVTLPFVAARYDGFVAIANGDVDVGSGGAPSGQLIALVKGRAINLPWAADIDSSASLLARFAVSGTLAQLQGEGFVQLRGRKTSIRSPLIATNQQLQVGPLLASDARGGSMWLTGAIDRSARPQLDATLMAHNFGFASNGVLASLPGMSAHRSGLPAGSGTLDGWAKIAGPPNNLGVAVNLEARHLAFANMNLGNLGVISVGTLTRSGTGRLLGQIKLSGPKANLAGIGLGNANAIIGLNGSHFKVYAATAQVAGGELAAAGDFSLASRLPDALVVTADRIDLGQLHIAGVPQMQGEVNAVASATDPHTQLRASLAVTGRDLEMNGRLASADADLTYNGSSISSHDSRVLFGNSSAVDIKGSIQAPNASTALTDAPMNIDATMHEGDLEQLGSLVPSTNMPLSGGLDANFHVSGSVRSPAVSGDVSSAAGTLRGVGYENLHARVAARAGSVALSQGGVTVGSSSLQLQGDVSSSHVGVTLASPHLDLTDFNDFFEGADVLAGTGAANISLSSSQQQTRARGWVDLHDAAFGHVPLGSIQAAVFTPQANTIAATVNQRSAVGWSTVNLSAAMPAGMGALTGARKALYTADVDVAATDLTALAPALPSAVQGVRGNLTLHANARGTPASLSGALNFNLANGYFRKQPIRELAGSASADKRGVTVKNLRASMAGVDLAASGRYGFNHRGSVFAVLTMPNMAASERLLNFPNIADGEATLTVDANGTLTNPQVEALLNGQAGQAFGIAYDSVRLDAAYVPGRLTLRNGVIALAQHRGDLTITGTAPVPVGLKKIGKHLQVQSPLKILAQARDVNIAALDPLLQRQGSLEGTLNATASATGTLANPVLAGSAALRDAIVRSNIETVPITALNADVAFSNSAIVLSKLHGTVGHGTVDASGVAHLTTTASGSGFGRVSYNMHLSTRQANLTVPKLFSGVLDADLGIDTTRTDPLLAGNLIVSDADFPFAGILALASGGAQAAPSASVPGVPPVRKGHTIVYGGQVFGPQPRTLVATPAPPKPTPPPKPIALSLTASAGDNVNVTGLVNATATGTLNIAGTTDAPRIEGSISTIRGSVAAFNTTFNVVRGIVTFHPNDGLLPSIDAQAVAYRPDADITVTVTGRVDQMKTDFESNPPMSQQEILADILGINEINNAMNGGAGGSGVTAQGLAGNYLTGRLLAGVNYGLEQTLHISEVDLAFDQSGNPTVELRQQYGKDLYALYRTSFTTPPQQTVGMLYEPRSWLDVEFLEKQNTAAQTYWQQPGQYYTLQATYKLPNAPRHAKRHHASAQPQGQPVNIGP